MSLVYTHSPEKETCFPSWGRSYKLEAGCRGRWLGAVINITLCHCKTIPMSPLSAQSHFDPSCLSVSQHFNIPVAPFVVSYVCQRGCCWTSCIVGIVLSSQHITGHLTLSSQQWGQFSVDIIRNRVELHKTHLYHHQWLYYELSFSWRSWWRACLILECEGGAWSVLEGLARI